jgi:hypothetical protein
MHQQTSNFGPKASVIDRAFRAHLRQPGALQPSDRQPNFRETVELREKLSGGGIFGGLPNPWQRSPAQVGHLPGGAGMSAATHTPSQPSTREVRFVHLGLPEARYYLGCQGHMHVFRRVGYRSGAFVEDSASSKLMGGAA